MFSEVTHPTVIDYCSSMLEFGLPDVNFAGLDALQFFDILFRCSTLKILAVLVNYTLSVNFASHDLERNHIRNTRPALGGTSL
jgi:hypothetical protein